MSPTAPVFGVRRAQKARTTIGAIPWLEGKLGLGLQMRWVRDLPYPRPRSYPFPPGRPLRAQKGEEMGFGGLKVHQSPSFCEVRAKRNGARGTGVVAGGECLPVLRCGHCGKADADDGLQESKRVSR